MKSSGDLNGTVALKIVDLQPGANGKFKCQFTDGKENIQGILTSQVGKQHGNALKIDDIVRVTDGNVNAVDDRSVLVVASLELVAGSDSAEAPSSPPPAPCPSDDAAPAGTPSAVPASLSLSTPQTKRPPSGSSASPYPGAGLTPAAPTPPSEAKAFSSRAQPSPAPSQRSLQPIESLNPYNGGWTIRARVLSKGALRSFSKGGAPTSVLSAELVDAAGTAIEATFWREAAERAEAELEQGGVYYFSRGSVKPANRRWSTVRNDYCLNFDGGALLERAVGAEAEQEARAAPRLDCVRLEQLPAYADGKATVDVAGLLLRVAALGSVKRRADASELARRDLTLGDDSGLSVGVTLWGEAAERAGAELEARVASGERPVLALTACRVSSYAGVSLSALSRSVLAVDPPRGSCARADEVADWWAAQPREREFAPLGAQLPGGAAPRAERRPDARATLEALPGLAPASPEDKPTYVSAAATLAHVNAEQAMWYLANPENNRKVVERAPGEWWCEHSGSRVPKPVRRFVFQARIVDQGGEAFCQVFDDAGQALLRQTADQLAEARQGDRPEAFKAALRAACWETWSLRLRLTVQEYNGELRKRYAVADVQPMDWALESRRMIQALQG